MFFLVLLCQGNLPDCDQELLQVIQVGLKINCLKPNIEQNLK